VNVPEADWTTAVLWLAVVGSGIYHGLNPGMGWPLAVSAGLMNNSCRAVFGALVPLAIGHFLAMGGVLLPFGAVSALVTWQTEIRIAAGFLVIAVGLYLFVNRRHPRFLARIGPAHLTLWSFAVALAHGAGLMLLPIYLNLCRAEELDAGHIAARTLMGSNLITALEVSVVHAFSMIAAGGLMAFAVYQWLGPRFISKSWFNLDTVWPLSLILVGAVALYSS